MFKRAIVASGLFGSQAEAVSGNDLTTGLTAAVSSDQAGATELPSSMNIVGTVGTAGDSVILPLGEAGDELWVRNTGANSMDVFPRSGGKINNGSADAALAVAANKTAVFKCLNGLDWLAVTTA